MVEGRNMGHKFIEKKASPLMQQLFFILFHNVVIQNKEINSFLCLQSIAWEGKRW